MIQFGDLAYEKEEFFVTYEGLLRLSSPRFPSGQVGFPRGCEVAAAAAVRGSVGGLFARVYAANDTVVRSGVFAAEKRAEPRVGGGADSRGNGLDHAGVGVLPNADRSRGGRVSPRESELYPAMEKRGNGETENGEEGYGMGLNYWEGGFIGRVSTF